jgi:uncharacterized protein YfaT (DUF1175 family)
MGLSHGRRGVQSERGMSKMEERMSELVTERVGVAWDRRWVVWVAEQVVRWSVDLQWGQRRRRLLVRYVGVRGERSADGWAVW